MSISSVPFLAERVEQLFAESGAYREGHFKLTSGRHGDRYIEKFQVLQWALAAALWSLSLPTYEPGADTCPGCVAQLPCTRRAQAVCPSPAS
ncbi:MAG: hypothetical protein ABIP53_11150 [Candidatus Limnocylindrales bacterium]